MALFALRVLSEDVVSATPLALDSQRVFFLLLGREVSEPMPFLFLLLFFSNVHERKERTSWIIHDFKKIVVWEIHDVKIFS